MELKCSQEVGQRTYSERARNMAKRIESRKGLQELLRRYEAAGANSEWINTVKGCIAEGFAMDETDWANTPKELRKLWTGLK